MSTVVIVESPTKSRTLQGFLGPRYKVLSSYGHIRDLPQNELGVDIERDFKPKYVIPSKSKKVIQFLAESTQKANLTILATDEDREGEAIAWHLTQALNLNGKKPYQRIAFHEITKTAIEEALRNPRKIDMNLVDAQQARRILDRIVGYKLSPFLWKKIARGLSAGRVQSVAVRLVVEREREIEKFVPQEYWSIIALLSKAKNKFEALLIKKDDKTLDRLAIKNEKEANKIVKDLRGAEYKVENVEKKEVKKNPFPPFTTSTLQQEAWRRFKFPAKLTMKVAQNLYERGLITYHRTDSLNLSSLALGTAKKLITETYGQNYYQFRKYKAKGRAQEAHEAVRPSYPNQTPDNLKLQKKLDENQSRLYDLIWRRFIACQMKEALFDSTTVDIKAKNYIFRATGQTLKFDGFIKVYPIKYEEAELPLLEKEEILELIKLTPSQHFTQPPPRYTEATLIKKLESEGIGRPSTYAPIISTIQERNYIEKNEKRYFRPTEIGTVVNDLLVEHFPKIVDLKFTANMEENLDEIAQGEKKWVKIIKDFYDPFAENLKQKYTEVSKKEFTEEPTKKKCPKCGAPLLIRLGKYGKFYACSKFPKCDYTETLPGKTLGIKCPKCKEGEIVEKRTKRRKIFYGCNQFPKCDFALWDKPTGEKCPQCGSLLIETKKGIYPVKSRSPSEIVPKAISPGQAGISPKAKLFNRVKCSNKDCEYQK
jgi:DNA topoisomerase-1